MKRAGACNASAVASLYARKAVYFQYGWQAIETQPENTKMNVHHSKVLLKTMLAGCALALAAGCATTQQVEEARAEAAAAQRTADEAMKMVEQARGMMQEAMQAARAAQSAADASQNCCTDLERKLDRALQDMQRK
ncbi:MAG: hypothetical protein RQ741_11360 [Wenzhouxiangellaceae bacterium]|nr:hypothetical protein [Wenzhouxiangellaceae bacterium]